MNRLGFCFGEAGADGIGASGETSVTDLDMTVRRTTEPAADGDVFVELRNADPDSRAEVTVHLGEGEARALVDAISSVAKPESRDSGFPIGVESRND